MLSSFAEAVTVIMGSCISQYDESLVTKCGKELVGKLINLCKKKLGCVQEKTCAA